jgi:EcoRII C terminal
MKRGYLSNYFAGIAAKALSPVEANVLLSNQHEFNGVESLRRLFGEPSGKVRLPATFLYFGEQTQDPVEAEGSLTWYDARERHPTRSEYRLYFPGNAVTDRAIAGDLLIIARRADDSCLVVVAAMDSTIASQLLWLFGLNDLSQPGYLVREALDTDRDRIAITSRLILQAIGIEPDDATDDHLEDMLRMFSAQFPPTRAFSRYARATLPHVDATVDPDIALVAWMEREEALFRSLERHLISDRLAKGFDGDVDGFISFSLSIQNRRKSRAGLALEHHMEEVFVSAGVRYERTAITENRSRPDYLFPGATAYHDPAFDAGRLTMLGVKSTCKDRWRQVLSEADRIPRKHLLTLEPAISKAQTDEMLAKQLQLVLPRSIHSTFTTAQQSWLVDVAGFVALLRERAIRPD